MRHEKTDLKVFVVVIPKEEWACMAAPILLLVRHRFLENMIYEVKRLKILKSRCHTKRRMGAATRAHPSLGMTTKKTLGSVFPRCASCLEQLSIWENSMQLRDVILIVDVMLWRWDIGNTCKKKQGWYIGWIFTDTDLTGIICLLKLLFQPISQPLSTKI